MYICIHTYIYIHITGSQSIPIRFKICNNDLTNLFQFNLSFKFIN